RNLQCGLEQTELRALQHRLREKIGPEMTALPIEPEAPGGEVETPADLPGMRSVATHALAPFGIVILAAAHGAHDRHDVLCPVGIFALQELLEDVADLERQAKDNISSLAHSHSLCGIQDTL